MNRLKLYISGSLLLISALLCGQSKNPVYLDDSKPLEERVEDVLSRMTVEEKVALCHAQSKFSSPGVSRLGIPEVWACDGPHGIREEVIWDQWGGAKWTNDSCIAFPALTCLAASWNPDMALLYGESIGEEARYRNKNMLLGPGVNIYRTPLNGRNFEYMGEDPYLASVLVVPYIQGVQKSGVAACVKHFALNNQEVGRMNINVKVDNRALHEIYLPAFRAAVLQGKAWAIMGAYNQYKNQHCCHNEYLLNGILKRDWGFDGAVVSDWGGVHNTRESIHNGLDMEFGTWTDGLSKGKSNAYDSYYLADPYLELLKSGEVSDKELNDKVRRILRLIFRTTMNKERPYGSFGTVAHGEAGKKIAEEGIVLLQNKGDLLPLDGANLKQIAVIGENAVKKMTIGGGSSSLKAKYEVSPLDGIRKRFGADKVSYAPGYTSGKENKEALMGEALEKAKTADVVLFFGGLNKNDGQDSEGSDRKDMSLPYGQDELIRALSGVNPKLVVVILSGNAVAMPWVKEVPAIVEGWYCGSESGNAIASVLAGDVNPSGKLPFTFPVRLEDNSAHALNAYPGDGKDVEYKESIFVGYRWVDQQKAKPLFCFGHGLSYTTFEYGKVIADKKALDINGEITCSVTVKNTGKRPGAEIVQLYISDKKSSLPRPVKELKGFKKISLNAGETETVSFTIAKEALQYYDDGKQSWVVEPGLFEALIGASSGDIRGKVAFELK